MNSESVLEGLIGAARRRARRQTPSTAQLLLTILQSDTESARILASCQVRERDLVSALKVVDEEPSSALEVAIERATALAQRVHATHVRPLHLLFALLHEPRSSAYRCVEHAGASAERVREAIQRELDLPVAASSASAPEPARTAMSRPVVMRAGPRIPPVPRTRATHSPPIGRKSGDPRSNAGVRSEPPANRRITPKPGSEETARAGGRRAADHEVTEPAATTRGKVSETGEATARGDATVCSDTIARGDATVCGGAALRNDATARGDATAPTKRIEAGASSFELDRDRFPLLRAIGRNLVALAAERRIDPVFGREKEIEQLLDVLGRRRANNPLLVGPPGVGKTAIVEALALEMVRPRARTPGLEGKLLIEVSAGALVAGTGMRGAVADRVRKLREEVARSEGRILLFLDEIHAIAGGEGPDDVASELKSALARGELPCIGATTEAEFRKYFARDSALARRFTRIDVEEPDLESAIRILEGIAPRYEIHHAVAYDPEAIRAAVTLSVRFLPERYLPEKALAVLDLAGARVRRAGGSVVGVETVAKVISDEAHVPLERLLVRDADRLLALESHLESRVVGQREAIARIADALRKGAAGFRGKRPLGTFLLLGPTGVGKTETAKAIADVMFGPGGMLRFDMSEFGEPHSVARLLGAPPGYVGHEEGGQLTEAVRRRPYQLVLLDEIEKAHPDVWMALLPLLDEGRLTDGRGRTVDFTNTVVVMTSNLGAQSAAVPRPIGFGAEGREHTASGAERAIAAARKALPPEFFNRIDELLYFEPLGESTVREIARRMLADLCELVRREHGIALEVEPSVIDLLIEAGGFDPELGARPMRRVVGRLVEAPLAARVLAGEIQHGDRVWARARGGELCFDVERPAADAEACGV
jgi:ATP-dependent Clp protease ATP-binding subunit ClpC